MTTPAAPTRFVLNGRPVEAAVDPDAMLIYVLRNDLGQKGTRFGCGLEQCGACTVLVDGRTAFACTTPLGSVAGRRVTTVEGLGADGEFPELIRAFEVHQAAQCGYCVSGILVSAAALLRENPAPDDAAVKAALNRNLCRCGAQQRMVRAVLDAAESRRG